MKYAARHNKLVDKIAEILIDKPYVDDITTELKYSKGELDIYSKQGGKFVYYEVKSSDSLKCFEKAKAQLIRYTTYKHAEHPDKNFYGVYISPSKVELICKNDKFRETGYDADAYHHDQEVRDRCGKGLEELIDVWMECEWVHNKYDGLKKKEKTRFRKDYYAFFDKFDDPFMEVIPEYMLEALNCAYENTK